MTHFACAVGQRAAAASVLSEGRVTKERAENCHPGERQNGDNRVDRADDEELRRGRAAAARPPSPNTSPRTAMAPMAAKATKTEGCLAIPAPRPRLWLTPPPPDAKPRRGTGPELPYQSHRYPHGDDGARRSARTTPCRHPPADGRSHAETSARCLLSPSIERRRLARPRTCHDEHDDARPPARPQVHGPSPITRRHARTACLVSRWMRQSPRRTEYAIRPGPTQQRPIRLPPRRYPGIRLFGKLPTRITPEDQTWRHPAGRRGDRCSCAAAVGRAVYRRGCFARHREHGARETARCRVDDLRR